MKVSQLLSPKQIKIGIVNNEKSAIIKELIDILVRNGLISDAGKAFEDVMERELQQSTGLEKGLAIPHGKSTAIQSLAGAMAISEEGKDFMSLDGEPSHIFFLMIAAPDEAGKHVRALANIAILTKNPMVRRKLARAQTPEEAYQIILDEEAGSL
ncbi:PTS sugar transporter subunit IIA [bacterium]|nr:PTS sugar transporter subunit IIA [bacterium]